MRIRYICATIITACSAISAVAQEPLTLQDCRQRALEHNHSIAIAKSTTAQYAFEAKAYKANNLPKLSATGGYLYTNQKSKLEIEGGYLPTFKPDASGTLQPNVVGMDPNGNPIFAEYAYFPGISEEIDLSGTYYAGLSLEQPVYMGGKVRAAAQMASVGKDIAEQNERLTHSQVMLEADNAYWNCVRANSMLKAAKQMLNVVEELKRNVDDAYEVGMKQQADVLYVQVKYNEALLFVRRAENAIRLSRMNICHVIGMPLESTIAVADTFSVNEQLELAAERTVNIANRSEYAMLDKQVELKSLEQKLTRSDFLPSVGIMANYTYANGLKLNSEKMLSDASLSALLTVKIPLFHWGEGANKIRAAKASYAIMQEKQKDLQEKMTLEAAQALNAMDEAQLEVKLTASSLQQAEEHMRVSHDNYEVGLATLANYLEAQTLWQKAYAEWISAMAQFRYSETNFLKASGRLEAATETPA